MGEGGGEGPQRLVKTLTLTLSHWERGQETKAKKSFETALDRQKRFGPVWRQVSIERVNEQRQETVVPHDQTQLNNALAAKLLQRRLEGAPADAMGAEEFLAIMHHRSLIGSQGGKLFAVSQGVYHLVGDTGLARRSGMGIPDVLTIQFPRRDQHGQFLDLLWQGGCISQVMVQGGCRLVRFRDMDHNRTRAITRYRPELS